MKFFSKYKKQIFSVFLCLTLFSCFIGFSFSSSAANVTEDIPLTSFSWWAIHDNDWLIFNLGSDGVFSLGPISSLESPEPYFSVIYCHVENIPALPSVNGKSVFLSVSLDITVSLDGSLRFAYSNGGNVLDAAAFRSCKLGAGAFGFFDPVAFTLLDHTGVVVDVNNESFWSSFASDGGLLQVNAIFDITSLIGYDIQHFDFFFPGTYDSSDPKLWASSTDYSYQLRVDNCNLHYTYKPFNDVVQDDLSDIKGSLSGVNNKLDSISSSMNTIDQDINRVDQKLEQTNETLGNIDQGIQDILKPSTPAVDFKNQWNDYFANNPVPDISALPSYDMSNMMTLLADSSSIIRNIFSPFFLRDYSVIVPLTQGFSNVRLDPVATYVSLSFGLSLAVVIIGLLKGSRG